MKWRVISETGFYRRQSAKKTSRFQRQTFRPIYAFKQRNGRFFKRRQKFRIIQLVVQCVSAVALCIQYTVTVYNVAAFLCHLRSNVTIYHRVPTAGLDAGVDAHRLWCAKRRWPTATKRRPSAAIRIADDRSKTPDDVAAPLSPADERRAFRLTTARHPLQADGSGFQHVVQLTRQLCDPATGSLTPADASRLTFHPSNWWNGRWLALADGAPFRRLDAKKTRNSFGSFIIRRPFAGIPRPVRRHWSVFSAECGVRFGSSSMDHAQRYNNDSQLLWNWVSSNWTRTTACQNVQFNLSLCSQSWFDLKDWTHYSLWPTIFCAVRITFVINQSINQSIQLVNMIFSYRSPIAALAIPHLLASCIDH